MSAPSKSLQLAAIAAVALAGAGAWFQLSQQPPAGEPLPVTALPPLHDPLDSDDGVWGAVLGKSPAPFWRKGNGPTYAPRWFANVGAVTKEVHDPREMLAAAAQLRPGDHLLVRGGRYVFEPTLRLSAAGTLERPIAIRAAPGEEVVFARSDAEKNVMDVAGAKYLLVEGITVRGGSNGVKFYDADHVMLYALDVGHTDGAAVTANAGETSSLAIVDCEIHHTGGHGEGLYLGGHNGRNITRHARVVGNYIHDLVGDHVEQGDGVEIKHGSYGAIVRYNFIRNTNYPGITAYGADPAGRHCNLIDANVIVDSHDVALQVAADAIVRNNLVINSLPGGRTFLSKPEELVSPRNLLVAHNTFIASGQVATFSGWNAPAARSIVFANNALYSRESEYLRGDARNATIDANVRLESLAHFRDLDLDRHRWNAAPKPEGPLQGSGSQAFATAYDLNGNDRSPESVDVGAIIVSGAR